MSGKSEVIGKLCNKECPLEERNKVVYRSPLEDSHPVKYSLNEDVKSRTVKFTVTAALPELDDKGFNKVSQIKGYFIIDFYEDGYPGEVRLFLDKMGTELHGFANAWAEAISMLLQYGVDPKKIYEKFKAWQFDPRGITSVKGVPFCKSIIDMVMKYMELNFLPTAKLSKNSEGSTDYEESLEIAVSSD